MAIFGKCIHCCEPLDSPDFRSCSRCCQLLQELGDAVVEPPARERQPGDDDVKPRPKDGKWLVWACNRRGRLREAQVFGRERGYPRDLHYWSPKMIELCIEALKRATPTRP